MYPIYRKCFYSILRFRSLDTGNSTAKYYCPLVVNRVLPKITFNGIYSALKYVEKSFQNGKDKQVELVYIIFIILEDPAQLRTFLYWISLLFITIRKYLTR